MKEQHKFVLVVLMTGILSSLVVALTLSYFAKTPMTIDHPVSVQNTVDDTAAVRVESHKSLTQAHRPIIPANTPAEANREQSRQHQAQLQQLEQRLNQLANTLSSNNGVANDVKVTALQQEEITPEEARAAAFRWWDETKMWFEREVVDAHWAQATNRLFESDLAELGEESGFSIVRTECRTTQCSAVLEWPSFNEASLGYTTLLHYPYQASCTRHTLLPEPSKEEANQPYQMTIIFDCSEWRYR